MRKLSYFFTFFAVSLTLLINILSAQRSDWLVVKTPEILHTKVTIQYGLAQRCERTVTRIPTGGPSNSGRLEYTEFECRPFPAREAEGCENERRGFCVAWTSARYVIELGVWFGAAALGAILFGISTHSRRRRIWRAVAGLVLLHALFQILAFGLVTEIYRTAGYPTFEHARPGIAYVFNTVGWIFGILIAVGVITTGLSADKGHKWAAGNRAYQPIGN